MHQSIPPSRKNTGDGDDKWTKQQEMTAVLLAVMHIRGHGDAKLPIGSEGHTMEKIVNWLSLCFVKGGKGDVVACGIHFKQQIAIIYFCNNETRTEADDTSIASSFEDLTQQAIAVYGTDTVKTAETSKLRENFLTAIGIRAWDLITVKKMNIYIDGDTYSRAVKTQFQVKEALEQWAIYNQDSLTADNLRDIQLEVNTHIKKLIALNLDEDCPKDKRRLTIKVIAYHATRVLESAFMQEVTGKAYEMALENKEDLAFLKRLYRRLWRLSRFYTGVDGYLNGLKDLHMQTKPGPKDTIATFQVKFVWIQQFFHTNVRGVYNEITLKETQYFAYIRAVSQKVINDCRTEAKRDENALRLAMQGAFLSFKKAKNTSMVGNFHTFKCTPKYHCETQLAQFFIQKEIGQRTIGCSKLTCWSCNVFLENIEAPSAAVLASASGRKSVFGHWHLSGSSAKSHFAWRIPDKQLFNNMNDDLWRTVTGAGSATFQAAKDELYKVLKDIYLNGGGPKPGDPSNSRFKHNRNKSFGSDSSTGSNWPVPVEKIVFDQETIDAASREEI